MQSYRFCSGAPFSFRMLINSSRVPNSISTYQLVRARSTFTSFVLNPLRFLRALVARNSSDSTPTQSPPRSLSDRVLRAAATASPSPTNDPTTQTPSPDTVPSPDKSQEPTGVRIVPKADKSGKSKSALMRAQMSSLISSKKPSPVQTLIKRPLTPPLRELLVPPPEADATKNRLLEFFDNQKNWGAWSVKTGRPWRMEELRLKSSADLHRLWYVLLTERNMLMTMQAEYNRLLHHMPNPERFEKVRHSGFDHY